VHIATAYSMVTPQQGLLLHITEGLERKGITRRIAEDMFGFDIRPKAVYLKEDSAIGLVDCGTHMTIHGLEIRFDNSLSADGFRLAVE